jgi:hypothetical protein
MYKFTVLKKKPKNNVCVFLSLLIVSGILVFVSSIECSLLVLERIYVDCCIVSVPALDRLLLCVSAH